MILIFTLFYLTNQVYCNDLNLLLLSESVLYGLSSLTNNIANGTKSKCERDLQILYDSVNEKHDWALKGRFQSIFLRHQLKNIINLMKFCKIDNHLQNYCHCIRICTHIFGPSR